MKAELRDFKKCCAEEIKRLWDASGGPMNVMRYEGQCPICNHYIGLTQTSKEEADEFLERFSLMPDAIDTYIKLSDRSEHRVFINPKAQK